MLPRRGLRARFSASPLLEANIVQLAWQAAWFFVAEGAIQALIATYRSRGQISADVSFTLLEIPVILISLGVVWRTSGPLSSMGRVFTGEDATMRALAEVMRLLGWQSVVVLLVSLPAAVANRPFETMITTVVSFPAIGYYVIFAVVLALFALLLTSVGLLASMAGGAPLAGCSAVVLLYALIGAADSVVGARFAVVNPQPQLQWVFKSLDGLNVPHIFGNLTTLRTGMGMEMSPGQALIAEAFITFVKYLGISFAAAYGAVQVARCAASARASIAQLRARLRAPYLWPIACVALDLTAILYVILETDRPKILLFKFVSSYPANVFAILLLGEIALSSLALACAPRKAEGAFGASALAQRLSLAAEMNGCAVLTMAPFLILANLMRLVGPSVYAIVLVPSIAAGLLLGSFAVFASSLGDGAGRAIIHAAVLFVLTALVFYSGAPFYSVYSGMVIPGGADTTAGLSQAAYPSIPLQMDQVVQLAQSGVGGSLALFGAFALAILLAASFFMLRWARDNYAEAPREPG